MTKHKFVQSDECELTMTMTTTMKPGDRIGFRTGGVHLSHVEVLP